MDGRHPIPQDWDLDSMNVGVYVEGGNVRSIFAIAMSSPRFVGGDAEDNANEKRGTPVARIVLGHTVR